MLQGAGYLLDTEYVDMDQHEDVETMAAFRDFVWKTFHPPPPPADDASAEVKAAFAAECEKLKVRCANVGRLSWETVDKRIYVKHNHAQVRKRRRMDGGLAVIQWSEGLEEPETDCVDAWQHVEEACRQADQAV
ncbi:hypothetical protein CYMTET_14235 [Cymbomonas tetramitiformis]|uniref:Uncharacterized protein n=1 Tax=Cymbomonas tetramitiformis TaxID=36881 RepID=A0AAE0GGW1_9CHLO|nr:hypothetical protein CYMTET_14235 [Cymbomonas tetramitiformis]